MPLRPRIARRPITRRTLLTKRDETPEAELSILDKLAKAEADLASIRDSPADPKAAENAKWALNRLKSKQAYLDGNDTEYWFAVCFESRDQKEAFLRVLDLMAEGDKYLWGPDVAEAIGFRLVKDGRAYQTMAISSRWSRHAMSLPPQVRKLILLEGETEPPAPEKKAKARVKPTGKAQKTLASGAIKRR